MNRLPTNNSAKPVTGRCAFVRVVAMSFVGTSGGYPRALHLAALKRPQWLREDVDQVHPGEGSA